MAIRDELNALATTFAAGVIAALRDARVDDVSAVSGILQDADLPSKGTGGARETPPARLALLVMYIKSHPGITGEAARKALDMQKHTWSTMAARGVAEGKLRKEGERRSTRYWAL